jgi:hypothetical protein
MHMPANINIVTALIVCLFALPLLAGILLPPTGDRIRRSFSSLFNNIILLASVVLAVYLTRVLLSGGENFILSNLYRVFPALQPAVANREVWVYAAIMATLGLVAFGALYLLTTPIYSYMIVPAAKKFASAMKSMGGFMRRVVGGLWQLPRAVWLVLVFALLLNFYTGFFSFSVLNDYANNSVPYQLIQADVIQPLLNNSVVKNIRVLLNDSFGKPDGETPIRLTRYFNGVPLDEAIRSNEEIDAEAKKIVGAETGDRRKARLLYSWVCKNISYDYDKAAAIARDASGVSSGAAVAFETRSGVCFDYSCLYVAMCRAVGLRVRFVTGSGYTGTEWGDHAWNQVYESKSGDWLDVDTTFGSSGVDYFDRQGFDIDHKNAVVQGEW